MCGIDVSRSLNKGRKGNPVRIIEVADLVTKMQEVKHPYKMGMMAREGIEF